MGRITGLCSLEPHGRARSDGKVKGSGSIRASREGAVRAVELGKVIRCVLCLERELCTVGAWEKSDVCLKIGPVWDV